MKIRDFFSRLKSIHKKNCTNDIESNNIECDTKELQDFVIKWTECEGWKFENFADFLELVGVKTPVKLSELDTEKKCFKCLTANDTEVLISVVFGDFFDSCSEICVKEGGESRTYITNGNHVNGNNIPKVELKERIVKRDGKELRFYNDYYFCDRMLKIDDTHTLRIEIREPQHNNADKSEKLILRNYLEIDNYLIGLDQSLEVSQVYHTVINLLGFGEEDIKNSDNILVSYIEKVGNVEKILSEIQISNGKLKLYVIHENGETFHIFQDGSWRYSFGSIKVFYLKKKELYVFSVTEIEDNISKVNPSEIMTYVKKRISEVREAMENTYRFS